MRRGVVSGRLRAGPEQPVKPGFTFERCENRMFSHPGEIAGVDLEQRRQQVDGLLVFPRLDVDLTSTLR